MQDYVCSCILRIARDLFSLLPLKTVYIHAYDEQLNTETGHSERFLILSIKIDQTILDDLNFENIHCSDAMNNFPHHMKFRKFKGFESVECKKIINISPAFINLSQIRINYISFKYKVNYLIN